MELEIRKIDDLKWNRKEGGYYKAKGYAFYVEGKGYMSFIHDKETPYTPSGGKKALQSIINAGGLTSYHESVWIYPIN